MKRTKAFTKTGQIKAHDSKFTGEEPIWQPEDLSVEDTKEKRDIFMSKAFSFYNYYLEKADFLYCLHSWMSDHTKYGKVKADLLCGNFPVDANAATLGSLARMDSRGVPCRDILCDKVDRALRQVRVKPEKSGETKKRPVVNFDKIARDKVQNALCELERLIDSWTEGPGTRIKTINIKTLLDDLKVEKRYMEPIAKWIKKYHDEYWMAFKGEDPDLVEGFAYLKKPALKKRIVALQEMFKVTTSWEKPKVARKPRQKRVQSADKQIRTLKYAPDNKEYSLTSVNPITIPGSQHLYVFNTKYKKLMVYHSAGADGFSVKGCSIKGFDPDKSYEIALRKPHDVLPDINARTAKQIEKIVGKLTTKKKKANGRMNANCIIQRVITNRGL
jgi:hypothetical protein